MSEPFDSFLKYKRELSRQRKASREQYSSAKLKKFKDEYDKSNWAYQNLQYFMEKEGIK